MIISDVQADRTRPRGSDYAVLMSLVRQAGLLRRRPASYSLRIAVNLSMLAAGWAIFVLVDESWWQLLTAAFLAVSFTQIGFLGHDAGHRQIFRTKRANDLVGCCTATLPSDWATGGGSTNIAVTTPTPIKRDWIQTSRET